MVLPFYFKFASDTPSLIVSFDSSEVGFAASTSKMTNDLTSSGRKAASIVGKVSPCTIAVV